MSGATGVVPGQGVQTPRHSRVAAGREQLRVIRFAAQPCWYRDGN